MISNISTNYESICSCFNFSKETSADRNKKLLLEMAENGEDKPHWKSKLGTSLQSYTSKKSYDPIFNKKIRELRPDWFVTSSQVANLKKQKLLSMAKNKEKKPPQTSKLGKALKEYTTKSRNSYCEIFTKQIKKLRPDWLAKGSDIKKTKIIQLAKSGAKRPSCRTKIGNSFYGYTQKLNNSYDPDFTELIKKLRPDWFLNQSEIAHQKKQKLIQIAKSGANRPHRSTKLGIAICSYTSKVHLSHDPDFTKLIKKLRPDWFKK